MKITALITQLHAAILTLAVSTRNYSILCMPTYVGLTRSAFLLSRLTVNCQLIQEVGDMENSRKAIFGRNEDLARQIKIPTKLESTSRDIISEESAEKFISITRIDYAPI